MSENKSAFGAILKRKFPSEARIMDAFITSDNHQIAESLGELIGRNNPKYQKIADIIEANAVADEVIYRKWGSVQDQLNEAFFGFVNWDTILEELDGERAKQEAVIQSTAKQREALRTRMPTALIVHERENRPPEQRPAPQGIQLLSTSAEAAVTPEVQERPQQPEAGEAASVQILKPVVISDPAPATEPAPEDFDVPVHIAPTVEQTSSHPETAPKGFTPPSTKQELLEHVEKLYRQKRQELEAIHTKKIDLINTHGERLLHEAVDDFLERIRRLETVAAKIDDTFKQEKLDPFLTSLHDYNAHQLQTKIAELQESQTKRQNAINQSWQMAIESEEVRNLEMLDKLKNQIAIARETYRCIEDSGVLDLKKITQSAESTPWSDMTINAYAQESKTRLLSDYLDEAALKHMRDTLLYLWNQTTEPEILVDMVNIFGSLLFSHLAPHSKGKLISVLIESMHNRSLVEAARILQHLAENEELCYRLSEKDLRRILALVESQNHEIRTATLSLIEKQLRLEQDGLIPVSSTALSQKLEEAIAHVSLRETEPQIWPAETYRQSANRR